MTPNLQTRLMVIAAAGWLGCALGLWLDAKAMLASYLATWFAVSAIPIGALGVLLVAYLVRAGWTSDLREPLTGAALILPFAAVLFIPIIVGLGWVYPWVSKASTLPAFKAVYLSPWFFVLRSVLYFTIWTALAVWAARAYGDNAAMVRTASAGLIVWTLTVSWAGVDWLESIEPAFHSSIYGLLTIGFDLLAGLAFGLIVVLALKRSQQMANASYGAVLLSTLLLWAYLHAMQYIIIWAGNIPVETVWYLARLEDGWAYPLWALIILQFVVPFFALLSEKVRSSTHALIWIAGATLVLRHLEAIVLVLPPLQLNGALLLLDLPVSAMALSASMILAWRNAPGLWQRWSGGAAPAGQHQ
jgi:hypothetical protein